MTDNGRTFGSLRSLGRLNGIVTWVLDWGRLDRQEFARNTVGRARAVSRQVMILDAAIVSCNLVHAVFTFA